MASPVFYPIFLRLEGRRTVVVGGGKVGLRKARGLLEAGASVVVVSPQFDTGFDHLSVEKVEREYLRTDLEGSSLAFAATDNRQVNRQVGEDARALGIPANVADSLEECEFIVPARFSMDGVQIAISTGGADPSRAAALRRRIEELLSSG